MRVSRSVLREAGGEIPRPTHPIQCHQVVLVVELGSQYSFRIVWQKDNEIRHRTNRIRLGMCYCRPVTVFLIAIGQSNLIIQKTGLLPANKGSIWYTRVY